MRTVVLAGGLGTRLSEETAARPKPMVEVGGRPLLWHLLKIYRHFGHREFFITLGYRGGVVKDYFTAFHHRDVDLTVDLARATVTPHREASEDWIVHLIDTGLTTQTGGRLKRLEPFLAGGGTFSLTYGDGLADIDLDALLAFHRGHGKIATVTAVRPPAKFGALNIERDQVLAFDEKPQTGEGWVNGGFFLLEPEVFGYLGDDTTAWESSPLEQLAKDGQLAAYRHDGFWHCVDTLRDLQTLQRQWDSGNPPWQVWE